MRFLTERFTGIFTAFERLPPRAHDPDIFLWAGTVAPRGRQREALVLGGAGFTDEAARLACLGEGIERFEAHGLPSDGSIYASYIVLSNGEEAIHPGAWVLFSDEQYASEGFPFRPFLPDTPCSWVRFRRASDGLAIWVPEDLASLAPSGEFHTLAPMTSSGLSAGRLGDPVVLRGLQELIERDALVGGFWGEYPLEKWPNELVFSMLPRDIPQRVERPNLEYAFYRIASPHSDHVTCVTTTGNDVEGHVFSTGSACRETLATSFQKSLLESLQGRHYVRYLLGERHEPTSAPGTFAEHALYYSLRPQALRETVFGRPAKAPERMHIHSLESLASLATRLGPERPVLVRVATPPMIAQHVPDFQVVRVLVPGLVPLHGNHALAHLEGRPWGANLGAFLRSPPHPFA